MKNTAQNIENWARNYIICHWSLYCNLVVKLQMIVVTCSSFSSTVVHFSICVFHFSTATLHQIWQCHVMSSHGLLHILPIIPELFPILCIFHYSQKYSGIISSGLLAYLENKTATATVDVRGWSAAVISFELDSKLVTPLLIIMSQEIADDLQFSAGVNYFKSSLYKVILSANSLARLGHPSLS